MRAMRLLPPIAVAILLIGLTGCAIGSGESGGEDAGDLPRTPPKPSTALVTPSVPSPAASTAGPEVNGTLPDGLRERPAVAAAIADLVTRENLAPEAIEIAAWTPVTWNDGSRGCPKPGMMYTQALEPGELLLLRTADNLFSYHAGADGAFTYCADPKDTFTVGS